MKTDSRGEHARRPLDRRRASVLVIAGTLAAALALVLAARPERGDPQVSLTTTTGASAARGPRAVRLATLDNSLRAIEEADSATPRDRWDPSYVVGTVGRAPDRLFAWVRDSTSWVPYRGRLRGPVGVLLDRQGNSLDRALLLAALLEGAGQSVRLARGELARDRAVALLPDLLSTGSNAGAGSSQPENASTGDVRTVAASYHLDADAIGRSLEAQEHAATRLYSELGERVAKQSERLLKEVAPPDPRADWIARFERAVGALQDHWWVQRLEGERWIDLDLLAPSADSVGTVLQPSETMAPNDLAPALEHDLVVRVVAEQWAGGALAERPVLQHVLRPSELYGQPIVLQFWPEEWPAHIHPDPRSKLGLRGVALEQREWGIALIVGGDQVAQAALRDDGTVPEPTGGGPLGALGAGMATALRPPSAGQANAPRRREMTAAWIEYELRAPGEAPRVIRRAVFDLIGPAARSAGAPATLALDEARRLTRSLALMIRTEILPVSAGMAPEYVTHLTARGVVANGKLLRSIAAADSAHLPDPDSLLAQAAPPVSVLYSLAAARLAWSPVGDRVYVDRLGLLTRHRHPAVSGEAFGIRGAIDVAAGEMGVSLAEPDAFEVRLRQGVLDTNAEALWWQGATVLNAGESYMTGRDWATLRPARQSDAGALQLPADARTRIAQDLGAGFVVIAPRAPMASGHEHFIGWWRIDPATGVARGVAGNGWGQCQEYARLIGSALMEGANSFAFDYVLCTGLAQGINAIRRGVAELQARGVWAEIGAVQYQDAATVFQENDEQCLIGAMMSGVLATLPIILKLRQLAKLQRAAPPQFLREAEVAHREAMRRHLQAMDLWDKYRRSPTPNRAMLRELEQLREVRSRELANAMEDLTHARIEARQAANAGSDRDFARELLELGFGGILRGK
ncbi:MAG TPA: hypothetical protein VJ803_01630 [Gemmatimonadaceae bacterium]|nr:hypothetical protein [Gemmatimonadaceae bacterium]